MDLSKFVVSQTKYSNKIFDSALSDTLDSFVGTGRSGGVDDSVLKRFLGVDDLLTTPLPKFWIDLKGFPRPIKGCFASIAYIFSHHNTIIGFGKTSEIGKGRGVFNRSDYDEKVFTNTRRALLTAEVVGKQFENKDSVPYSFAAIMNDGGAGKLVKSLLKNRLELLGWDEKLLVTYPESYKDFYEQSLFYKFHETLGLTPEQYKTWLEGAPLNLDTDIIYDDLGKNILNDVTVDLQILLALSAKPFLIMSGPSGTGKTLGIRKFAQSLNPHSKDASFNITFIPVEAGWKDSRFILGYKNPFSKDGEIYQGTPLVEMMLKASLPEYSNVPFFVVFDEMNLSHVEMYFAKFLSLIETSRHGSLHKHPVLTVEELRLLQLFYNHDYEKTILINNAIDKGGLFIENNIFFIGTVNIDETTYMFSPKVLDRAFVIEVRTDSPKNFTTDFAISVDDQVKLKIMELNDILISLTSIDHTKEGVLLDKLDETYNLLEEFKFGHRVVMEVLSYNEKTKLVPPSWAKDDVKVFDRILLQKILPKLYGNKKQLTDVISSLLAHTKDKTYVLSYNKLEKMQRQLSTSGYTSFIV